jgi:hypothetical protein
VARQVRYSSCGRLLFKIRNLGGGFFQKTHSLTDIRNLLEYDTLRLLSLHQFVSPRF